MNLLWSVTLGLAVAPAGCCDEGPSVQPDGGEAVWAEADGGVAQPRPLQDPTERKLDLVIECHNRANRMMRLVRLYFDSLEGAEPGPKHIPMVERSVEDAPQACAEARAATTPAIAEVDGMMPQHVQLVGAIEQDLAELERYYGAESFKGDGFRGAKELHRRMQRDSEAFGPAHERLGGIVEAAEDRREAQEIERMAGDKGLRQHQRVYQRDAKLLVREVLKKEQDARAIEELLARAEASWAALGERAKTHQDELARAKMFGAFEARGAQFMEAARAWKQAKDKGEASRKLVDAFNAMVDALNVVKWN